MDSVMKHYLVLLISPFLISCGLYPQTPMHVRSFPASERPAKHLIILLSGRGAQKTYFDDQQWVEIARQHGLDVDFIAPHAHFGYYLTQSLLTRLHEDVILPAKKKAYQTISIAGISMGGLGSILYSRKYPNEIDRLFLFAPSLGNKDVHDEIRQAGGLSQWQIKDENAHDWNYYIWQRMKEITQDPIAKKKIFLAYGKQDHLPAHDILAQAIPEQQVITITGGHKDVIFTQLWEMMLEKKFLQ